MKQPAKPAAFLIDKDLYVLRAPQCTSAGLFGVFSNQ